MNPLIQTDEQVIQAIKALLYQARSTVYQTINHTMTQTYWQIGRHIVEIDQQGDKKAQYG